MSSRRRHGFPFVHSVLHIILALTVIVMTVFAFLNPTRYMMFFPMIFLLFSINCLLDGIKYFKNEERQRYGFFKAIIMFVLFLFMFLMSLVGFFNI